MCVCTLKKDRQKNEVKIEKREIQKEKGRFVPLHYVIRMKANKKVESVRKRG